MESQNQDNTKEKGPKIRENEAKTIDLTRISFFVVPGFMLIWVLAAFCMFIYAVVNYEVFL